MVYLGGTLHSNGKFGAELARKLGIATADFKTLSTICKHTQLTTTRKLAIFDAIVVSRLRYATASAWLSKGDLRKLDGFHARCLRTILRIKPSFVSRISNTAVLNLAGRRALSLDVRRSQLKLLGEVVLNPAKSFLKEVTFQSNTVVPLTDAWVRRVGRPRHEWATQLLNSMKVAAGNDEYWRRTISSLEQWKEVVDRVCA